jgi:hypothetical protein
MFSLGRFTTSLLNNASPLSSAVVHTFETSTRSTASAFTPQLLSNSSIRSLAGAKLIPQISLNQNLASFRPMSILHQSSTRSLFLPPYARTLNSRQPALLTDRSVTTKTSTKVPEGEHIERYSNHRTTLCGQDENSLVTMLSPFDDAFFGLTKSSTDSSEQFIWQKLGVSRTVFIRLLQMQKQKFHSPMEIQRFGPYLKKMESEGIIYDEADRFRQLWAASRSNRQNLSDESPSNQKLENTNNDSLPPISAIPEKLDLSGIDFAGIWLLALLIIVEVANANANSTSSQNLKFNDKAHW